MADQSESIRRVLPRGRNALDRESVAASQRARLLEAICEMTANEGYADITINKLIARAGVAKPTFYEHFESKEACLLAFVEVAVEQLKGAIVASLEIEASTEERIRLGLEAVVEYMIADEDRARTMLVESFAAGRAIQERINDAYEQLAQFYRELREESRIANPEQPPMSIVRARAIVGAIKEPLAGVVREGRVEDARAVFEDVVDGVTLLAVGHHANN